MSKRNRNSGSNKPTAADQPVNEQPTDAEATTADAPEAEAAPVDPFAELPTITCGEGDSATSFTDFSDVRGSDPRKYAAVHKAAVGERLPTVKNWKHQEHMLVLGNMKAEKKAGTVYGDIQQIVNAAGRAGIPAYVVASMLRRKQIGNKRSVYCTDLPPVGWAEGWINTAITKGIAGVHPSKQAPAIRSEVTEGEAEAQKALAANG